MNIQTFTNADAFIERVQPFLEAQEAANSLISGIALRVREKPEWLKQPLYEAVIGDETGKPLLVALQTPPQAIDLLVENLRSTSAQIPEVNAENRLDLQFAEHWSRASGQASACVAALSQHILDSS